MQFCNCVLPCTNPDACRHCVNNVSKICDTLEPFEWPIIITNESLEETRKQNEEKLKEWKDIFGI